jgi:pantetheine-phosphate adenylyltransferase
MKTIAVYPGSFDPPTFGHLDIIARSSNVFFRVIVSVAKNLRKDTMFTATERIGMLRKLTRSYPNVEVDSFRGLLIEYVRRMEAHVVVRGLRAISEQEALPRGRHRLHDDGGALFLYQLPHRQGDRAIRREHRRPGPPLGPGQDVPETREEDLIPHRTSHRGERSVP